MMNKRSLVVVTGASRGLGQAIATEMAGHVQPDSVFLLFARDAQGLQQTKARVQQRLQNTADCCVLVRSLDNEQASEQDFSTSLEQALAQVRAPLELAIVVHNAGSLGPQGTPIRDLFDERILHSYFSANLFSVMKLNSAFMSRTEAVPQRLIINISSLAALQPFATWSLYCMCKASRDMLFRVLSAELKDQTGFRILNYAPGPLRTDMITKAVLACSSTDPEVRKSFEALENSDGLLSAETSASRLMAILCTDSFSNGDHIDYYDQV